MKTGLSLSLCVIDILAGRVRLDDVVLIRANTMARDEEDWEHLVNHYCRSYWRQDPGRAREIVQALRDTGRIHQHRLTGDPFAHHPIHEGIWISEG